MSKTATTNKSKQVVATGTTAGEKYYKELLKNDDDMSFAYLFVKITKESYAYAEQEEVLYRFNKDTTLWESIGKGAFKSFYTQEMSDFFDSKIALLKKHGEDEEDTTALELNKIKKMSLPLI